ncbi:unnamed protein product [Brassica oleracea]
MTILLLYTLVRYLKFTIFSCLAMPSMLRKHVPMSRKR